MKTDDEVKSAQPKSVPPSIDWQPPDKRITFSLFIGLILLIALTGGWPLMVVVVAIVVMIFLHELGHYLTAKRCGMKVTEFFIGFGPKLWSFNRGETEYGVKAIPAGAYVRIIGMNNLEEVAPEDEPRTYRQQSYPKRMLVVCAGSGMHFLLTMLCVFLLLTVTGAPGGRVFTASADDWEVLEVAAGSPAAAAGLLAGDRVVSIDGEKVDGFTHMREIIQARPGQTVQVQVERGGDTFETSVALANEDGRGRLGVTSGYPDDEKVGVIPATGQTFVEFGSGVQQSIQALGALFSPSGISDFASQVRHGGSPTVESPSNAPSGGSGESSSDNTNRPVSIIGAARIGTGLTANGLQGFLVFFATINLFIGIVNMVPLLPLDGGHAAIATYERIRSRKGKRYQVDVMKLLPMTYAVVLVLVLLFVSTVFLDLVDPISVN